jgi:hypothetical protein
LVKHLRRATLLPLDARSREVYQPYSYYRPQTVRQ